MSTLTIGTRDERLAAVIRGAADWLCLAAAPAFAAMALITGGRGGAQDMLCAGDASPLTGMAGMYMLMSAIHLAPWLRRISCRRGGAHQS